jgi:hypothetical protein
MPALPQPIWDAVPKSLDVAQNSVNLWLQNRIKALCRKTLGTLFDVLKRRERDIIRMPPSIFPGWPQRNFRNFLLIGSNNK